MIPVNEPLLNGNEKKYLTECIDTGWISSEGPFVREFEEKFSSSVNRKFGIAVSNGTAALDVAVTALELTEGDEIIMPTFTIISCITQIVRLKLKPVLIDSDPVNWNMDISQVEKKITNKTKAIMVVHIYGLPVDMDPILDLAEKYNLKLIEDAAEMHGQTYNGKPCGSFGDVSIFSFYPNKHITTGEGGMVVTDNPVIAEKCRSLRNLCFQAEKRFVHEDLGWNYRMTNMQAALGLAQLERIEEFIIKKREMGRLYTKLLSDIPSIQLPLESTHYAENIYWVFGLVLKESASINSFELASKLKEYGIGTRPFFYPLHLQPVLKKMGFTFEGNFIVSENLYTNGLYVPSGLALKNEQIEKVSEILHEVLT